RDINVIDAPAFTGDGAVTSHPPAHNKLVLHDTSSRKAHYGGIDKSGRVTGPRLSPSQRIATATVDRAIVTALNKRATGSKDVLKGKPVIVANLQHPAIKAILKVEVVAERYVHHALIAGQCNSWRKKLLVADRGRIIYKCSIGRRIGGWH